MCTLTRHTLALLAFVAICLLSSHAVGLAQYGARWIIELDTPIATSQLGEGASGTDDHTSALNLFRSASRDAGIDMRERFTFQGILFSGLSVDLSTQADAEILSSLGGVKRVWPVRTYVPRQSTRVANYYDGVLMDASMPLMRFTHDATGVGTIQHADPDVARLRGTVDTNVKRGRQALAQGIDATGTGVRVGVIDTGIDYTHPAFGGCLGLGCRVSYGRDLVGNDDGTPQPRSDPRDCAGHGSHVAGIIAGNDQRILGVAPNATLAAYKVFTCDEDGGVSSDVLIAAMEQAYLDGMNVINLSVGGSSSWSVFPEAVAAGALARMGVLVVAAVGNDGTQGLWETSSPAIDASATAVGSLENTYYLGGHITLTKANTSSLRINYAGNDDPADIGAVPLIHVASNGCNNVTMPSLSGAIALVRRGGCTVAKKAKAASSMGAKALAVYNNVPGQLFVFATGERESTGGIPVVGVSGEDGERMAAVASGGGGVVAEVRWEAGIRVFGNYPRVLQPAEYSSWGYGPMFEVKPDISAPGSIVYSAYPVSKGSYATMSGTSMSTPYLAGAMALLVSRFGPAAGYMISDHPKLQLAKAIVQSTATKIPWPRNPTFISPACRVGSGMINVEAALSSPAILLPSVIHIPSIQQSNSFYLTKIQIHRVDHHWRTKSGIASLSYRKVVWTLRHEPMAAIDLRKAAESGSGPGDGTFSTSIPETADILPAEVDFETPVVTTEFLANASTSKTLPLFTVELPELASAGVRITPPLTVNAPYWFGGAIVAVPSDPALHSIRTVYVGITGDIGDVPIIPLNGSYPYLTITPSTNVSSLELPPGDEKVFGCTINSNERDLSQIERCRAVIHSEIPLNFSNSELSIVYTMLQPASKIQLHLLRQSTNDRYGEGGDVWSSVAVIFADRHVPRNEESRPTSRHAWKGLVSNRTLVGGPVVLQMREADAVSVPPFVVSMGGNEVGRGRVGREAQNRHTTLERVAPGRYRILGSFWRPGAIALGRKSSKTGEPTHWVSPVMIVL